MPGRISNSSPAYVFSFSRIVPFSKCKVFTGQASSHSPQRIQSFENSVLGKVFSVFSLIMERCMGQERSHFLQLLQVSGSISRWYLSPPSQLWMVPIGQMAHHDLAFQKKAIIAPKAVVTKHTSQKTNPQCCQLPGSRLPFIPTIQSRKSNTPIRTLVDFAQSGMGLLGLYLLIIRSRKPPRGQRLPQNQRPATRPEIKPPIMAASTR